MVVGAKRFWVAELGVRQHKIGRKSCFGRWYGVNSKYLLFLTSPNIRILFECVMACFTYEKKINPAKF